MSTELPKGKGELIDCHMCGACCTEISISSAIHIYHPDGKPAGTKCAWLNKNGKCDLFDSLFGPKVCSSPKAEKEFCGENHDQAVRLIRKLEAMTS